MNFDPHDGHGANVFADWQSPVGYEVGDVPLHNERSAPRPAAAAPLVFQQRVDCLVAKYAALWRATETSSPELGPIVAPPEKARREAQAERSGQEMEARLRRFPRSKEKRGPWRCDLLESARRLTIDCLGYPEAGLKHIFTEAGIAATRQFVRDARAFDRAIPDDHLFQALRNLWVIHSVQALLESEIELSPSTFGYSMLYPWTDNYLDDPQVPAG